MADAPMCAKTNMIDTGCSLITYAYTNSAIYEDYEDTSKKKNKIKTLREYKILTS